MKTDPSQWRRDRLREAAAKAGGNTELGRKLGYKDGAYVGQMVSGHRPITEKTIDKVESLPGFEGWFTHSWDVGEPVVSLGSDDTHPDDYIQIRESEVRFAAGNGRTAHYDELAESVPATYRREWFVKEGINPNNARRFKVHGDSMEPFLYDGDTVLVNLGETTVINNKVYALRYGDELRIKRVSKKLDGGLILHSDNPNYLPRDEDLTPAIVQEHISIIGRVRDKSGTGGL